MKNAAGCFGFGVLGIVFWFISSCVGAFIVQWVLSWFHVYVPFWGAFAAVVVLSVLFGGGR